jgi:transcriptional regulator NrdR family protein
MKRERQPKPDCPFCGHYDSLVSSGFFDTRMSAYVRRRRCQNPLCQRSFETEETLRPSRRYPRRDEAQSRELPQAGQP